MSQIDELPLAPRVTEALARDLGKGLARLDPSDIARLGLKVGDVVEITMEPVERDLDPELITFTSQVATVRLCAANVVSSNARRPLLPAFTLPAELPPVCYATTFTPIESLRASERIVWELVFVRGGLCDIDLFCLHTACRW